MAAALTLLSMLPLLATTLAQEPSNSLAEISDSPTILLRVDVLRDPDNKKFVTTLKLQFLNEHCKVPWYANITQGGVATDFEVVVVTVRVPEMTFSKHCDAEDEGGLSGHVADSLEPTSTTTEVAIPQDEVIAIVTRHGKYIFYRILTTWVDANCACKTQRMHLAIMNSEAERDELFKQINANSPPNECENYQCSVHAGFHKLDDGRLYNTVQGQSMKEAGFNQWDMTNLTTSILDCGSITREGLLRAVGCLNPLAFVCEV